MKQFLIFLCFLAGFGSAVTADDTRRAINQQVWAKFTESYRRNDVEMHASIYHPEIVRAAPARVLSGVEFLTRMRQLFKRREDSGLPPEDIQFRFFSRLANKDSAFERGVYRLVSERADGSSRTSYGAFQVVLKKHNGVWTILFDTDTGSDVEAWNRATPIES